MRKLNRKITIVKWLKQVCYIPTVDVTIDKRISTIGPHIEL